MAVTNESSQQILNLLTVPPTNNPVYDWRGSLRGMYFKHTQGAAAGDQNSTANLVTLPAGNVRVLGHLSKMTFTAFGAARLLDIGTRAYVSLAGAAVAEVAQVFASAVDVSAAGSLVFEEAFAAGTFGTKLLQSRGGVTIFAKQTAAATWPVGAVIEGVIIYLID